MQCEMCGKEQEFLKPYVIEGVTLKVCPSCGKYGKPAPKKIIPKQLSQNEKRNVVRRVFNLKEMESTETIVDDYDTIIRNKRTKMQMTQEDFAKKLAIKESIVHSLETGRHEPSIPLAKKIESILGVKLIAAEETPDDELLKEFKNTDKNSKHLTLGDIITIRRRK